MLAAQQKLAPLARQHFERLVEVLQSSARADQRAIAATVLGQAHDKVRAAEALDAAARDPSSKVRNNAIRALGLLLAEADMAPDLVAVLPIETYLDLLESLTWTDRNKAMLVLLGLSRGRNEAVLARLRACSVETLAEMAAWQTEGHALMALILLGRIAGLTDAETVEAWRNGKIEQVVDRARKSQN